MPAFYAAYAQPPFTFSSSALYARPPRRLCIRPPSVHYYPNHIFSTSLHCSPCRLAFLLALLPLRPPPFRRLPPLPSALLPSAAHLRRLPPPPTSAAYLRRPSPPPTSAAHLRRLPPPPTSAAYLVSRSVAIRADLARRNADAQPVHTPTVSAAHLRRPPGEPFGSHSGGLSKAVRRSAARYHRRPWSPRCCRHGTKKSAPIHHGPGRIKIA